MRDRLRSARDRLGRLRPDPGDGGGGGGDTSTDTTDDGGTETDTSTDDPPETTDTGGTLLPDPGGSSSSDTDTNGSSSTDTGDSDTETSGPTRRRDRRGGRDRIGGGSDSSDSSPSGSTNTSTDTTDSDTTESSSSEPPGGPAGIGGDPPTDTTDTSDSGTSDDGGLLGDVTDTASDAAESVGEAANDAVDAGRDAVDAAGEVVDDAVNTDQPTAGERADQAAAELATGEQQLSEASGAVTEAADDALGGASDAVDNAGEEVNETADSVGQDLQDAGAAAAEPVADATNDNLVGETVEDFVTDGSQIPGEAVANAPETVATAGDVLADAAKGAGAAVSAGDPMTTPTDESQAAFDRNEQRADAAVDATIETGQTVKNNPSEIGGVAAEAAVGVATGSALSRGARVITDADTAGLTRRANQAGLDTRGRSVTDNLQDRLSNVDADLRSAGERAGEVLRAEDRGQGSPGDILDTRTRSDTSRDSDTGDGGTGGSPAGGDSGAVVDLDELEEQVDVEIDADGPADPVDADGAVIDARAMRGRDDDETTTAAPETDPAGGGRPATTTDTTDLDTQVGGLSPGESGVAGAAGAAAGIDETTAVDPFDSTFGPRGGALGGVDAVTDTTVETGDPNRVAALDGFADDSPLGTGTEPATTPRVEDTPVTELREQQPTTTTTDDLFTDTPTDTVVDDVITGTESTTTGTAIPTTETTPTTDTTPTQTTPTTTTPTTTTPTTTTPTQTPTTDTPTDTTPSDTPTGGGPTGGPPTLIDGPTGGGGGGGGRPRPPGDDPPGDDDLMGEFGDYGLTGEAEQAFEFEGFDDDLFGGDR